MLFKENIILNFGGDRVSAWDVLPLIEDKTYHLEQAEFRHETFSERLNNCPLILDEPTISDQLVVSRGITSAGSLSLTVCYLPYGPPGGQSLLQYSLHLRREQDGAAHAMFQRAKTFAYPDTYDLHSILLSGSLDPTNGLGSAVGLRAVSMNGRVAAQELDEPWALCTIKSPVVESVESFAARGPPWDESTGNQDKLRMAKLPCGRGMWLLGLCQWSGRLVYAEKPILGETDWATGINSMTYLHVVDLIPR